jgi:hypothetical protein
VLLPQLSRIAFRNLEAIQTALRESSLDGWLFYDHHHCDPIAGCILGLDEKALVTRCWTTAKPLCELEASARTISTDEPDKRKSSFS